MNSGPSLADMAAAAAKSDASNPAKPRMPPPAMGAQILLLSIPFLILLAILGPRAYKKGIRKSLRWFINLSQRGPCFKCCHFCCKKSLGKAIQKAPLAPHGLKLTGAAARVLVLAWKHGASSTFSDDNYELQMKRKADDEDEWRLVYQGGDTSHRCNKLSPATEFCFRVRAVNAAGASGYTDVLGCSSKQVPHENNGGTGPGYSWSQTSTEVLLYLTLPKPYERPRDLLVDFSAKRLSVKLKGEVLLEGELRQLIKTDSVWEVEKEDGAECSQLLLTMEKVLQPEFMEKKDRWSCVILGHPEIDILIDK